MLALTSPTGKLGGAVLNAILEHNLIPPSNLVICTSSDPSSTKLSHLQNKNLTIRHADFNDPSTLTSAYHGCSALFLVSAPAISLDYNSAPPGQGREKHHFAAINAALDAGVKHIYYTSLAFANPSKASVMTAHERTEAYLNSLREDGKVGVTILREGLYSESWPLYFGYYYGLKNESRKEVVVAGDGSVSWTAIKDMALVTAKILSEEREKWNEKTVYLSQNRTARLEDVAKLVSRIQGRDVGMKIVGRKEYKDFYVGEMGMERASVEWWSSSYDALNEGECAIEDDTLEKMLGRKPKPFEETIEEMLQ